MIEFMVVSGHCQKCSVRWSEHSGQTSGMRKGLNFGRPRANFALKFQRKIWETTAVSPNKGKTIETWYKFCGCLQLEGNSLRARPSFNSKGNQQRSHCADVWPLYLAGIFEILQKCWDHPSVDNIVCQCGTVFNCNLFFCLLFFVQIFHRIPSSRVLACAPSNSASDLIVSSKLEANFRCCLGSLITTFLWS